MTTTALSVARTNGAITIDYEAVLASLNLDPRDPKTQTLLLLCDRYDLDPVQKHLVLIGGNAYVTRDGYLAIAHRSGQFDGMEVLEQDEDKSHFIAKVAVFRKDMAHPFAFVGRFPKSKSMAKEYGPEMAVKVAEVQALRRAFNVTGIGAADEQWDAGAASRPSADLGTGEIIDIDEVGSGPGEVKPIDDVDSLTARELADALRARGLDPSGSKAALRFRLEAALAGADSTRGEDSP